MKCNLAVTFFVLGLLGKAEPFKPSPGTTSTVRLAFEPGGLIRVEHSRGYVRVEGWERPEVEVTAIKSMPYNYKPKHPEQAGQHLEALSILATRRSDKELDVSTTVPSGNRRGAKGVMVDYEIHVPRDSRLIIHHDGGNFVSVSNVSGDIDAASGHGDIVLMLPETARYSIDAKSKFGVVSSEFPGMTRRKFLIGEAFSGGGAAPEHRLHLRVGFGGITIVKLPPDATGPSQLR